MITNSSAQLICGSERKALDDQRALVLVKLCASRFSFDDFTESLNCSESLVRSLLARRFRPFYSDNGKNITVADSFDLSYLKRFPSTVALEQAAPGALIGREKEIRAQYLAGEIRSWLNTFEASDTDRLQAIKQSGSRLDQSTHYQENKYILQVERVASDILWAWRPFLPYGDRPFRIIVGRWLAAWVHFWAADPDVWNCALEILLADFGQVATAA